MKGVLITGGSGLIGRSLTAHCINTGTKVHHLSRNVTSRGIPTFRWNPDKHEVDPDCLEGMETIIHLAGESVAGGRWTAARKRWILSSRVNGLRTLKAVLLQREHRVRTVITASGVGYYGFCPPDNPVTENSPAGADFLAEVCRQWEGEAESFTDLGLRVAAVRIGLVLSAQGGALPALMRPIRWGVGAPLGSGRQGCSWIHIDDLCSVFLHLANNNSLSGPFNAVSPYPCTNAELTRQVALVLKRPLWLPPVPGFVLRAVLGEMAGLVLGGAFVSADRLVRSGFRFRYSHLREALQSLVG
jgi:hypothetical protein